MIARAVKTYGGIVKRKHFHLTYKCQAGSRDCPVWIPQAQSIFCVSLLNAPSGSGKTTFLEQLYKQLGGGSGSDNSLNLEFEPDINAEGTAMVAYINNIITPVKL